MPGLFRFYSISDGRIYSGLLDLNINILAEFRKLLTYEHKYL